MKKVFLCIFTLVFVTGFCKAFPVEIPKAEKGILDLRSHNFDSTKVALSGYWNFYENSLRVDTTQTTPATTLLPQIWDANINYATYQLTVLLPESLKNLALEIPQVYSSYELWINGQKLANNGTPGISAETTVPQWLPQIVSIESVQDTMSVVLKVANFYHHKGGVKEPIYLGTLEMLSQQRSVAVKSNLAEFAVLAILGIVFFAIYYIREERKKITLYFALLCLGWAIRSVFSNLYLAVNSFPDFNWSLLVKIEYITLYLTMIWAILFLSRLFPNESNTFIKYILVGLNCIFIAITLVLAPLVFTQWLSVFLIVAGTVLLTGCVIVVRALVYERTGVWYLVVCILLGIILFGYDISVYEGYFSTYNPLFFSIGYITMFFLLGISLLYHLRIFKGDSSSETLTYEDLYSKK